MDQFSRYLLFCLILVVSCKTPARFKTGQIIDPKSDTSALNNGLTSKYLRDLLKKELQSFGEIAVNPENKVQIIYTRIDRDKSDRPFFTDLYFQLDDSNYFYPASTVKLPVAVLALQKLHELNLPGLDVNSTMITGADFSGQSEVYNDPTSPDGRPTIAHYIKKILLVSDNDAFNRLYEFLGQEYINNSLHKMGYDDAQIIHRLEISLSEEENRHTNPITFLDSAGNVVYQKAATNSHLVYADRNTKIGKGFYRGGQLVNEPFDFSKKNRLTLKSLHSIVRSVLFPEAVPVDQRFNLSVEDYIFLRKYMSMLPGESVFPPYPEPGYWDTYVKFLLCGAQKGDLPDGLRIFNKVGDAYGFLIDAAYIADFKNNVEFMLSAVIYCNRDGILNDNKYDYDVIGFPFMKNLGRVIYNEEVKREREHIPDLSKFIYDYHN